MVVAIDQSPVSDPSRVLHRVRGTGSYIRDLLKALQEYHPEHTYIDYSQRSVTETDVVHIPYFEPYFFTIPSKKTAKTIITVHDVIPLVFPKFFPSGISGKIRWLIQRKRLQSVDAIITDSQCSRRDIIKVANVKPDKVHVVCLSASEEMKSIESEQKKKEVREKYSLPDTFALYVGDATWNKNLPRLVAAAEQSEIPLVMAGSALVKENIDTSNPWNRDLVKVQEMIKSSTIVRSIGFVDSGDLPVLYTLATVFVMPSLYEGFGLPVLEAMKCGCPVITTRQGSLEEVASDASYYVDAYSVESIAVGIKTVVEDTALRKTLSEKGKHRAAEFSWKKVANETMQIYEE